jgi:hypothetical protein
VTFDPGQFTPAKWDTAADKARFAKQFVRFVESGFSQRHFTEPFYQRLGRTFGHVAHSNRLGFWETYFTTTADKVRFLEYTSTHTPMGDPEWTYSDVERQFQSWLFVAGTLKTYQAQLAAESEAGERAEYEHLHAKFAGAESTTGLPGGSPKGISPELRSACEAMVDFSFDDVRVKSSYAQACKQFCRLKRELGSALAAHST